MKGLNVGSRLVRVLKFVCISSQNTEMILPLQGKRNWTSEPGFFLIIIG